MLDRLRALLKPSQSEDDREADFYLATMGTFEDVNRLDSQVSELAACRLLDFMPLPNIVGTAQPSASPLGNYTTAPRTRDEHKCLL